MLTRIEAVKCADCGADIVSESKDQQHTNGHWNEHRKFSCGGVLHFSPNFMKVLQETVCPKNAVQAAKVTARAQLISKLRTIITNAKVDPEYAAALQDRLNYIHVA